MLNSVGQDRDYAHRTQARRFLHNETLRSVGFRYVVGIFKRHAIPQRKDTYDAYFTKTALPNLQELSPSLFGRLISSQPTRAYARR